MFSIPEVHVSHRCTRVPQYADDDNDPMRSGRRAVNEGLGFISA
jgi:hypothetical protein